MPFGCIMANQTIYGCLDTITGQVTFEGEACDSGDYLGCLEVTGDHVGQIAVIINDGNCDDTYYACFEPSTGQFQLVIPDDCCGDDSCEHCNCSGEPCTPSQVTVTFSGISTCTGCRAGGGNSVKYFDVADGLNGNSYVIPQVGGAPCYWRDTFIYSGDYGYRRLYTNAEDCSGDFEDTDIIQIQFFEIQRYVSGGEKIRIDVNLYPGSKGVFDGNGSVSSPSSNCMNSTVSNGWDSGDCPTRPTNPICYGGTATVEDGDQT